MTGFRRTYEVEGRRVARSVARQFQRATWLSPNMVTATGTVLNGVAAVIAYHQHWFWASVVFLVGSLLDSLDGALAKVTGQITAFGAFLDSTLDRVSEGLVLGGLALYFARHDQMGAMLACFVALGASILVSYTRARAEVLGIDCKGGLASRVERVALITAGLFFSTWSHGRAIEVVVYLLAAAAAITVVQRMAHVNRELSSGRRTRD